MIVQTPPEVVEEEDEGVISPSFENREAAFENTPTATGTCLVIGTKSEKQLNCRLRLALPRA